MKSFDTFMTRIFFELVILLQMVHLGRGATISWMHYTGIRNDPVPNQTPTVAPTSQVIMEGNTQSENISTDAPTLSPTLLPSTFEPTVDSHVDYFDQPREVWAKAITGDDSMETLEYGYGNGIKQIGRNIFISFRNGGVVSVEAKTGDERWRYFPHYSSNDGEEVQIVCRSSLFYAIMDTHSYTGSILVLSVAHYPQSMTVPINDENLFSQVIALDALTGEQVWASNLIPGRAIGTPIVTQHPRRIFGGAFVVLTHNTGVSSRDDLDMGTTGHLTILKAETGEVLRTFASGDANDIDGDMLGPLPYGPIGVASTPFPVKTWGTAADELYGNPTDLMVWSTAGDGGTAAMGQILAFQILSYFNPDSMADSLKISVLREVRWSALAAPGLTHDGRNMVMGIRGSEVRAWLSNDLHSGATWRGKLREGPTPILYQPTFDNHETKIFVASPGGQIAAYRAEFFGEEDIIWTSDTSSQSELSSCIHCSPDDLFVYSATRNGTVEARDTRNGQLVWILNCDILRNGTGPTSSKAAGGADCIESIRGEIEISASGMDLYFCDTKANCRGMQLGTSDTWTFEPSPQPSTIPSQTPSHLPSAVPSQRPTELPTTSPSSAPTSVPVQARLWSTAPPYEKRQPPSTASPAITVALAIMLCGASTLFLS